MTTHAEGTARRLRATIIGLGLDGGDGPHRIITGEQCLLVGGSAETHAAMLETILRLEDELERAGRGLGELSPPELAEIAAVLPGRENGDPLLPDGLAVFRGPILRATRTRREAVDEVRDTIVHELGHYFGLSDEEMPH